MCDFSYAHDQIGPQNFFLMIFSGRAVKDLDAVLPQIEDAADQLAELLQAGTKLESVYTFASGRLLPGFPE